MPRLGGVNKRQDGKGFILKLSHFKNKKGELVTKSLSEAFGLADDEEVVLFLEKPEDYFANLTAAGIMQEAAASKAIGDTPEFVKLFCTGVIKGKKKDK